MRKPGRPEFPEDYIEKMRLYLAAIYRRTGNFPTVAVFHQQIEKMGREDFVKWFGKTYIDKTPSVAWFNRSNRYPKWKIDVKERNDKLLKEAWDSPWTVGSVKYHPVREEAIPFLLGFEEFMKEATDIHLKQSGKALPFSFGLLTVRAAKWISNLIFCFDVSDKEAVGNLLRVGCSYAAMEYVHDLAEAPFSTRMLDSLLREQKYDEIVVASQYILQTNVKFEKDGE